MVDSILRGIFAYNGLWGNFHSENGTKSTSISLSNKISMKLGYN